MKALQLFNVLRGWLIIQTYAFLITQITRRKFKPRRMYFIHLRSMCAIFKQSVLCE